MVKKKKKKICSLGPPSHRDQTLDQPPPDSSQSLMTFILIFYLSFSYALDIRFPMIVLHLSALAASLWVRSNLRLDNLVPSSKSISCLPIQIFITKCGAIKKPGSWIFSVFFIVFKCLGRMPIAFGHGTLLSALWHKKLRSMPQGNLLLHFCYILWALSYHFLSHSYG